MITIKAKKEIMSATGAAIREITFSYNKIILQNLIKITNL